MLCDAHTLIFFMPASYLLREFQFLANDRLMTLRLHQSATTKLIASQKTDSGFLGSLRKTPPETYYPFTMPFNGHLTVWIRLNAIEHLPVFPLKRWGDLLYSISTQFISSRVIYSAEQGIAWRHVPKCLNLSAMNSFHPFWPCVHSYRNLRSKVSPPKYDEEGGGIG